MMARFRSSASKTRARRSQCPGPVGSGALQAGGLRKFFASRGNLTGSPSRLPLGRYHENARIGHTDHPVAGTRATTRLTIATLRDMSLRRALIAAVVSALVLAGCGAAEKVSPRVAVREAAKETASQKEGTYTLTIQGSEADLNAVLNEGLPLSAEDREGLTLLRNGHIAVSTAADKFGLDIKAGDLEHAFELRYVDKKLYARADVGGLAKLFGASPEEIDQTVQALASREGFEFLAAAASGKWLVADFSALKDVFEGLGKQFGLEPGGSAGETGGSTATSGPAGGGEFKALKDALGKALSEDVSIEELKSDSVGDHY